MNYRKIGLILLALLLAGMAMIPLVSAADNQNEKNLREAIEANYVPADKALDHATFALNEFASYGALGEKEIWLGAVVNPKPVEIYDVNGTKLFYLFAIEKNDRKTGEIKVAATKVIGTSVYTIGPEKNSLDISTLEQKVRTETARNVKKDTQISTKLVIYAYPKIGMMAEYTDDQTNTAQKIIIDAYDYTIIPDTSPRYEGDRGIVSFYASYPTDKLSEFIESWNQYDRKVSSLEKSNPAVIISGKPVSEESLQVFASPSLSSKAVTEYEVLSPFPLYGGETTEWCTVGTAQMISAWYGVSRTQTAIASKMGIPTSPPYSGANLNQELNYYQGSIASGGLGKPDSDEYDYITWYFVKDEIDNGRPFKVGDEGHARAAVGYIRSSSTGYTYIYFKDPSPQYQGSEYWEWYNELNPTFYDDYIQII